MSMKWTSALLLIQLSCYLSSGTCGKVLVWPTEFSHWMNIKTILDELVQRGHEVTVLAYSTSILPDPNNPSALKYEICPTSLTETEFENDVMQLVKRWLDGPKDIFWPRFLQVQEIMWTYTDMIRKFCKDVVSNKKLMKKLQESRFDVVLADPISPCGELLAELLKIPFVYSLRSSPGYPIEKHGGGFLFPPSYVPVSMSELRDQMTFMERVQNMMYMVYFDFWFQVWDVKNWDQFYSEVLGRPTTVFETMAKAEIWLIRNYWDFQFPHPLLPNVEFVGGLHCKPAKPLPKEMEEFVQSSGENGIVVFSLGSMVSNMSEERANVIASALAKIPQKINEMKAKRCATPVIIDEILPSKKMKVSNNKKKPEEEGSAQDTSEKNESSPEKAKGRHTVPCMPPIKQKVLKSTEEQELEKSMKMQQEVVKMRKKNEEFKKLALAGIGQPVKKSVSQVTKSVDFHFRTDEQIKQYPKNQEEYKEVNFTSEPGKHPSSPARVTKGCTIVKPFNLSQGKKRTYDETVSTYVPLAQQVEDFHKRNPNRYHLRSKKNDTNLLPSKSSVTKI
ncbi:hypothetical protein H8959_019373 [Pygathrix nigripes]